MISFPHTKKKTKGIPKTNGRKLPTKHWDLGAFLSRCLHCTQWDFRTVPYRRVKKFVISVVCTISYAFNTKPSQPLHNSNGLLTTSPIQTTQLGRIMIITVNSPNEKSHKCSKGLIHFLYPQIILCTLFLHRCHSLCSIIFYALSVWLTNSTFPKFVQRYIPYYLYTVMIFIRATLKIIALQTGNWPRLIGTKR